MSYNEKIHNIVTFNHNQISTAFRGICSLKWSEIDIGFLSDVRIVYSCYDQWAAKNEK